MEKPFSPACERNKDPILGVLREIIPDRENKNLIEVGSGTGQHAVYLAQHFPMLNWYITDQESHIEGIKLWLDEFNITNISKPTVFKIGQDSFPKINFDYLFLANVLHIISWDLCLKLFDEIEHSFSRGELIFYGPFNYNGNYTSSSNKEFDSLLKSRDSKSGIRNFEDINCCLNKIGFKLVKDYEMPANNRILYFKK